MQIAPYHEDRTALLPFFAMADDSPDQIATYLSLGEILVARDDGAIIGHLQTVEAGDDGTFEIKSMAVSEQRQRQGVGRGLIAAAIAHCHAHDGHRLIVATAAADTGNLRFYQQLGFRMARIVRDAFTPSRGYPEGMVVDGIPLCDQVFLDLDLNGDSRLPI
jgi:GNAT superfamily N-acetyltransferase